MDNSAGGRVAHAPHQSPAVWIVGVITLIVLWLPPLPWRIRVGDFPVFLAQGLIKLGLFKPEQSWPMRVDFLVLPALFIYAAIVLWKSRVGWEESGLGFKYFGRALQSLWFPTFVGVLICIGIGWLTRDQPIEWGGRFWRRLIPLNALVQQMAIQLFFHRQLMAWCGTGRKAAAVLTLFFVALHAPNPGLMLGTLCGMYWWARTYQKAPNLYALSISHALLSAVLMQTFPKWLLPSVSVGHRFIEKAIANAWWGWLK